MKMEAGILKSSFKLAKTCAREISVSHKRPLHLTKRIFRPADDCAPRSPNGRHLEVCTISDTVIDPGQPQPSVIIVGAGLAGLSAAQRLNQTGITNFTILEATDRPGGRIHSCWLGDVIAEMGAHHIIGACAANPIYNLACQEGLLSPPVKGCKSSTIFYTSEGRVADQGVAYTTFKIYKQLENEARSLFLKGTSKEHGSLMNFFSIRFQQELQHFPHEQQFDASRVFGGLTSNLRSHIGEDLNKVSADNFGSTVKIPGGRVRVPLGYVGVLAPLLKDLPNCSLKYSKAVASIRWDNISDSESCRAIVTCCDGEEYRADYVIVTVSLGVLKFHADKLFCPILPKTKTEAINLLGNGHLDKIFLEYSRPFWVPREGNIHFGWSPDELKYRNEWTRGLSRVEEVEGSRHVLCAYVAGPEAAEMERATDEEVAESITKTLRQFTGDVTLPYPNSILRSKWSSNPFFCGAYSYLGVNSTVGNQCDLSTPLPIDNCGEVVPVLFFAGEATCPGHHSFTHGARLSGIREAERIIQLTKKHKGVPRKRNPVPK